MNRPTKSLLATGLGGAAALVWIPQVLRMSQDAEPAREELPAEAGATLLDGVSFLSGSHPEATTPPEPDGEVVDLDALERRASRLEERSRPQVGGEIARLLEQMEARAQDEAAPASAVRPPVEAAGREDRRRLERFTENNPLTGLVRGGAGDAVLLGHRVVRVGDRLDAGHVRLAEIGASWVRLTAGAEECIVELPPFQARTRAVPTGSETVAPVLEDVGAPSTEGGL